MKVLVVGGGGQRACYLLEDFTESVRCDKIYCAPGNAGISQKLLNVLTSRQWNLISLLHLLKKKILI